MRKVIGIILIGAAVVGLILSITGITAVWVVKERLTDSLVATFDLLGSTLDATNDGLFVADQTLTKFIGDITTIESTIQTASTSIEDTVPLINSFQELLNESLPTAVQSIQTALVSAQSSAQAIEGTLQLLSSIPFLPIGAYNPEIPLGDALGAVSSSLEPIPQSFIDMADNLGTSQDNLVTVADQVSTISQNVGGLKTSLTQTQLVLSQFQTVVSTLQNQIDSVQESLPTAVTGVVWFATIFFFWLGITQIGLLTQGLERLRPEETVSDQEEIQESVVIVAEETKQDGDGSETKDEETE
jgi:hypothetical protein